MTPTEFCTWRDAPPRRRVGHKNVLWAVLGALYVAAAVVMAAAIFPPPTPPLSPPAAHEVRYCAPSPGLAGGYYACRRDDIVIPL